MFLFQILTQNERKHFLTNQNPFLTPSPIFGRNMRNKETNLPRIRMYYNNHFVQTTRLYYTFHHSVAIHHSLAESINKSTEVRTSLPGQLSHKLT
eukprot:TRINITY_DN2883_c1_g1_i1.p1 TRINITY_DN2883_c1_g1~~TRINITY_DN2883_c1_g1_i1.p1  ORF type:complete len:95 (+),score=8.50 TRINITY_DN2883_c1_g1_i1:60-344(+)